MSDQQEVMVILLPEVEGQAKQAKVHFDAMLKAAGEMQVCGMHAMQTTPDGTMFCAGCMSGLYHAAAAYAAHVKGLMDTMGIPLKPKEASDDKRVRPDLQ